MSHRDQVISLLEKYTTEDALRLAVEAVSTIGDVVADQLEEAGYDSQTAVSIGQEEDEIAVDGSPLVPYDWGASLGLEKQSHPYLWSEVGLSSLYSLLREEGFELTSFDEFYNEESEVEMEYIFKKIARELKVPLRFVERVADDEGYPSDYYYSSVTTTSEIWAKPKSI